ncbi:very short patch repair endonuclease [Malaciobacter mytili]|uniref:very short patch repair endonuclease n=1 Tax=Malaciobacter mytili TaxID=603050 RepID=UPI00100A5665|nr:very short patch repair endonuclease [Malaciobacter mytili]RXI45764.1 very short patch repair endonuclease [Malaciobacter mytili]
MDRSENMRKIKSKDTSIEIKLRKELWKRGYRYRKNCKDVFGKPDICFKKKKIAIFCDSEFWHGKYYKEKKYIPKTNTKFWIDKFERNIKRDKEVNKKLKEEGWITLRFWEYEIKKDINSILNKINNQFKQIENK